MRNLDEALSRLLYSFDIESTSSDPLEAHVLTASIVKMVNGRQVDKRSWALNPGVEIPQEAIDIHGLTEDWIEANGVDPKAPLEEMSNMIVSILNGGFPLVIYNAAYDLTALEVNLKRHDLPGLIERVKSFDHVIDPYVLSKGYETYKTREGSWGLGYKLPEVCARYGVVFTETHDALADAVGAGELAIKLAKNYSLLNKETPASLHAIQLDWRVRLQKTLRDHFDKKGIEHDGVDDGWPLHNGVRN